MEQVKLYIIIYVISDSKEMITQLIKGLWVEISYEEFCLSTDECDLSRTMYSDSDLHTYA
jgi:hypothetical protein